jgi:hypothetical protein
MFEVKDMIIQKNISKILSIFAVLSFLSACDDETRNQTKKYYVTIVKSDHIELDFIHAKPERKFAKPRIEVHHPEGVEVVPEERKPRKNIVYDFAPVAFGVFALMICYRRFLHHLPAPALSGSSRRQAGGRFCPGIR